MTLPAHLLFHPLQCIFTSTLLKFIVLMTQRYNLTGQNIHTSTAVKDILLSSTLLGSLGAGLFSVEREAETGRVLFKSRNLPVGTISKYLSNPFT